MKAGPSNRAEAHPEAASGRLHAREGADLAAITTSPRQLDVYSATSPPAETGEAFPTGVVKDHMQTGHAWGPSPPDSIAGPSISIPLDPGPPPSQANKNASDTGARPQPRYNPHAPAFVPGPRLPGNPDVGTNATGYDGSDSRHALLQSLPPAPPRPRVPIGWFTELDYNTNEWYYVHSLTNHAQRHHPDEAPPKS